MKTNPAPFPRRAELTNLIIDVLKNELITHVKSNIEKYNDGEFHSFKLFFYNGNNIVESSGLSHFRVKFYNGKMRILMNEREIYLVKNVINLHFYKDVPVKYLNMEAFRNFINEKIGEERIMFEYQLYLISR